MKLQSSNSIRSIAACSVFIGSLLFAVRVDAVTPGRGEVCEFSVPNGYEDTKSPQSSGLPFYPQPVDNPSGRFQQIYHASQFSTLPPEGAFLFEIRFRGGCDGHSSAIVSNILARICATDIQPDRLNPTFEANLGPLTTEVSRVAGYFVSGFGGCDPGGINGTTKWDSPLRLSLPYFYRPTDGNLLLDLTMPFIRFSTPDFLPRYETVSVTNDSISSIYASPVTKSVADRASTEGLVTQFSFSLYPRLRPAFQADRLILRWRNFVPGFALQTTDRLTGPDAWMPFQGSITADEVNASATIPRSELEGQARYFRLYWESPQPGFDPSPPASALPETTAP